MAQTEDTELRDLVIETLEKNGSLAKIRALLRANIFLAFEDECENQKQNVSLDNLLRTPEGVLTLSIVHEFLEACNLKNTLFVYKSESRQGKDYNYFGKKHLADNLCPGNQTNSKEPVLLSIIRNLSKSKSSRQEQRQISHCDSGDSNYKDEQNNSYIVHEDSQSTNTSQSDNSMDEKNKLHLRLQLDNSDTDTSTSTDSTRDKSSSEYIPSDHIPLEARNCANTAKDLTTVNSVKNVSMITENTKNFLSKLSANNSSDSTSYIDLKPFSPFDEKALNTTGIPYMETNNIPHLKHLSNIQNEPPPKDSAKSATLSSLSSISLTNESLNNIGIKYGPSKSDGETADYTYDFTTSEGLKNKCLEKINTPIEASKTSPVESPHQNSQSSISISDVADLISEKSSSIEHSHNDNTFEAEKSKISISTNDFRKKSGNNLNKHSDDSGDFTESPVPSLSNLSLDIHSD